MLVTLGITLPTPCGDIEIKYTTEVPLPSFDFSFLLNFPPKWRIPMPDCSLLKHTVGGTPEPAEDSQP